MTRGDLLEIRVARLWFWEGYYARRGVDLRRAFDPQPLQVTDLDLFAIEFSPSLQQRRFIGEAKGGTSKNTPKPLDRVVWLKGLASLVHADGAELVHAIPSSSEVRQLAHELGVRVQTVDELTAREDRVGLDEVADIGAHSDESARIRLRVHSICSGNHQMSSAYWFLRTDVWLQDCWSNLKRLIALVRYLARQWTPRLEDDDRRALEWLFAEALSAFSVNLVDCSSLSLQSGANEFGDLVRDRLSAGPVPPAQMKTLSRAIDRYLGGVLKEAGADPAVVVQSMGAFEPQPPEYADSLAELARRVGSQAWIAQTLPRVTDVLAHEGLIRERSVDAPVLARITRRSDDSSLRDVRLMLMFLRSYAELPADVAERVVPSLASEPPSPTRDRGRPSGDTSAHGQGIEGRASQPPLSPED